MMTQVFVWVVFLALGQVITGKVVAIHDGDSITVHTDDATIKVRLYGIDAPELGQAFSQASRQRLSELCFGKDVTLRVLGFDRYGRMLADVLTNDSTIVNYEMIRSGLAWHFKRYSKSDTLESLERLARAERMGLWRDPEPVPPWDFRKNQR
jgi:endonuclease YncB( thermonuclease family)